MNANVKRTMVCLYVLVCLPAVGRAAESTYRIAYATYLGGRADEQLREVISLPDGSILVGGQTSSHDLPVTPGAVQPKYGGEPAGTGHPGLVAGDCFVARLSADGTKVLACTYFGGSKQERNTYGFGLDSRGNLVLSSATRSSDLRTTKGACQEKYGGGKSDMFAAKLTPDLKTLLWSTYVGGRHEDWPRGGITLDKDDHVYIVGGADGDDFPVTRRVFGAKRKGKRDAAIVKLKPDGSGVAWATFLGGSDWDGLMGIRVDDAGNAYVAGHTRSRDLPVTPGVAQRTYRGKSDCFVAKLSADATSLAYCTYLGGRENEFAEHQLRLLKDGSVLVTGVTGSPDFPTTPGAVQRKLKGKTDGFLTKIAPDGKRFVFSTLLGGSGGEFYLMPTPGPKGNLWIVGNTSSADFPATRGALQTTYGGARGRWGGDGALAVLSPDGSRLLYATYLGGRGDDLIRSIAFGPKGEVYLVGSTSSKTFPTTPSSVQPKLRGNSDAFVVKLVPVKGNM
jgi:hypothetical protein